ncbi:MAG: hypothetical protein FJ088_04165, partial [Deltaproteobacteria bacterium]|nr:hypothetical protein [Deltaproteobacteria bacterium]
ETMLGRYPSDDTAVLNLERFFSEGKEKTSVAALLMPVYETREEYAKLVDVYSVLASSGEDAVEKVNYYNKIKDIYEARLHLPENAFNAAAMAFRAAPEREDLVSEVLRTAENVSLTGEAVSVLVEKVSEIADEYRRRETHRTIARTALSGGLDKDIALKNFNEILQIDPSDIESVDALIGIQREREEYSPLVVLIKKKVELTPDAREKCALLMDAAAIYENSLKDTDRSIETLVWALDVDPSFRDALLSLERLYEQKGSHDNLVNTLSRRYELAHGGNERIAILKKKGDVIFRELGNAGEAIEAFRMVLALDPLDIEALRKLDSLYTIQEDWLNLRATLESIDALTEGDEQIMVKYRLGRLFAGELGEPQKAVGIYEEILKASRGHTGAISALQELVFSGDAALESFNAVVPELEKLNEWEKCYLMHEKMAEREEMPVQRVEYLKKMAWIAEEKLDASGRAFECMGLAFKTIPEDRAILNDLERLASVYHMWEDIVPMLLDGAKIVEGSELSLSLRLKAAQLLKEKIGDPDSSIREYLAITADYPDNRTALNALDGLYLEKGSYDELAKIVEMQIDVTSDREEKVQHFLRLGTMCENNLKDASRALKAYREIIYLTGGDERGVANLRRLYNSGFRRGEILEVLEPIYYEKSSFEDLIDLYELRLEELEESADRLSYTLKIAELFEKKLYDNYKAFEWYGKGLVLNPSDDLLLSMAEDLAKSVDKHRDLMEVFLEAAKESGAGERKIQLWHKAADISLNTLKEKLRAENIYRWILELKGDDLPALQALDAMYQADGRYSDLVGVLGKEIESVPYEDDKLVLHMRAGDIMLNKLDDEEGAEEAFQNALSISESHREALDRLAGIYEKRENFGELYGIYERILNSSADLNERIGLMQKMAVIAEKNLSRRDSAIELYEEIIRNRSGDTGAMRELERLYSEKNEWDSFIRICEHELEYSADNRERQMSLLKQVARAEEEFLRDSYRSQQTWKRVLDIEPYDLDALFALRRLYREIEDYDSLIGVLSRLEEKVPDRGELRAI